LYIDFFSAIAGPGALIKKQTDMANCFGFDDEDDD
jgi:hypothetical protein